MGWEEMMEDAKKRHRPRLKDWSRDGFATKRAADFEALRARNWAEDPTCRCRIAVENCATLTPAQFVERYERTYTPVLLRGCINEQNWPAKERWTIDRLKEDFRDRRFKCGEDDDGRTIRVTMRDFAKYTENQTDDSPLYIFDSTYDDDSVANRLLGDYSVPKYFPTNPDQEPFWAFSEEKKELRKRSLLKISPPAPGSPEKETNKMNDSISSKHSSDNYRVPQAIISAVEGTAAVGAERDSGRGLPQSTTFSHSRSHSTTAYINNDTGSGGAGAIPSKQEANASTLSDTSCEYDTAVTATAAPPVFTGGQSTEECPNDRGFPSIDKGRKKNLAIEAEAIDKGVGYHDLFSLVGERRRPPYRWLLVGPRRSGTCVHIDPLGSSAWNRLVFSAFFSLHYPTHSSLLFSVLSMTFFLIKSAVSTNNASVIRGRKLWVIFPPNTPRSVVKCKKVMLKGEDDEAINYFVDHIPRLKRLHPQLRIFEFIQGPGDTVFIPGGWWHAVLNLDDTIGVTQNYCSRANFDQVWREARGGRKKMAVKWLSKLHAEHPDLALRAEALNVADGFLMYESGKAGNDEANGDADREEGGNEAPKKKKKKKKEKEKKSLFERGDCEARYGPGGGRSRRSATDYDNDGSVSNESLTGVRELLKLAFPPNIASTAAEACQLPPEVGSSSKLKKSSQWPLQSPLSENRLSVAEHMVQHEDDVIGVKKSTENGMDGGTSQKRRLSNSGCNASPGRHKVST